MGPPDASNPEFHIGPELFKAAIQPLCDFRQGLPPDLSPDEIRVAMRRHLESLGEELDPVLREGLLDQIEAEVGVKAESGVPDILSGYFWPGSLPGEGFELPVIQAIITPFTPRKEFLAKLDYAMRREFGPLVRMRPASLREGARSLILSSQGMKDKDIADLFLSEEGAFEKIAAESDAEREKKYRGLLRRRTAKIRQFRKRFGACVTNLVVPESRE